MRRSLSSLRRVLCVRRACYSAAAPRSIRFTGVESLGLLRRVNISVRHVGYSCLRSVVLRQADTAPQASTSKVPEEKDLSIYRTLALEANNGYVDAQFQLAFAYDTGAIDPLELSPDPASYPKIDPTAPEPWREYRRVVRMLTGKHRERKRAARAALRQQKLHRKSGGGPSHSEIAEEFDEEESSDSRRAKAAMELYKAAASAGHVKAKLGLANMLFRGRATIAPDPQEAARLYQEIIKEADATDALFNLGQLYYEGSLDGKPDLRKAFECFDNAALKGDSDALFFVGVALHGGTSEKLDDVVKVHSDRERHRLALEKIENAVSLGHPGAAFYLANMYASGDEAIGGQVDMKKYLELLKSAASCDYGDALFALGSLFYEGNNEAGVIADYVKARKYFRRGADAGSSDCIASLGAMCYHGLGGPKDLRVAHECYAEAAEQGNIQSLLSLGSMYFHGEGVRQCPETAQSLLQIANALQKDVEGQGEG